MMTLQYTLHLFLFPWFSIGRVIYFQLIQANLADEGFHPLDLRQLMIERAEVDYPEQANDFRCRLHNSIWNRSD